MTLELATFLQNATDYCGGEQNFSIYTDYSGRGMGGKITTGVVIDSLSILLLNVMQYSRELELIPSEEVPHPTIKDYIPDTSAMNTLRQDNLASQIILY